MKYKKSAFIILLTCFLFTMLLVNMLGNGHSAIFAGGVTPTLANYIPYVEKAALPTATATATTAPVPTIAATPTQPPAPSGCSICSFDAYNCSDFSTHNQAQACHDYCFDLVGFDVHKLDADGDGEACESLP